MNEPKFSKGPWRQGVQKDGLIYVANDERRIAILPGTDCGHTLQDQANAKLISAAPELYEALKDIMGGNTNGIEIQKVVSARASLTKATQ